MLLLFVKQFHYKYWQRGASIYLYHTNSARSLGSIPDEENHCDTSISCILDWTEQIWIALGEQNLQH